MISMYVESLRNSDFVTHPFFWICFLLFFGQVSRHPTASGATPTNTKELMKLWNWNHEAVVKIAILDDAWTPFVCSLVLPVNDWGWLLGSNQ